MNENRSIEADGGLPELVDIKLAEIDPFDVRGDDKAGGAKLLDSELGLACRCGGIRQRHRCEQREPSRMAVAKLRQRFVHQPMPARRDPTRQAVGEDVWPHREQLAAHALRRHSVEPLVHRLDQLCEKRADLQAIVEMQRALRRRLD